MKKIASLFLNRSDFVCFCFYRSSEGVAFKENKALEEFSKSLPPDDVSCLAAFFGEKLSSLPFQSDREEPLEVICLASTFIKIIAKYEMEKFLAIESPGALEYAARQINQDKLF